MITELSPEQMERKRVISIHISTGKYAEFLNRILGFAAESKSAYVCVANVHMTIEAYRDADFAEVVNAAALTTPDGVPLLKSLKYLYGVKQERVAGMDLMPDLIRECGKAGISLLFFGSSERVLDAVVQKTKEKYPGVVIAGAISPPFRAISDVEEMQLINKINDTKPGLVFVALGCPKQELWMAKHSPRIQAPLIGVGGAFLVYAGLQMRARSWMRAYALEWLYRLAQEPARLWKRYLYTNSLFLYCLLKELLFRRSVKTEEDVIKIR